MMFVDEDENEEGRELLLVVMQIFGLVMMVDGVLKCLGPVLFGGLSVRHVGGNKTVLNDSLGDMS